MHPSKPASLVLLRLATLLAALKISDLFALAHAVRHNYAIQEGGPGRARAGQGGPGRARAGQAARPRK